MLLHPALQVRSEVGDVTILINNAGIVTGKKFYDIPDHMAELTFQVNTIAHLWVRAILFSSVYTLLKGQRLPRGLETGPPLYMYVVGVSVTLLGPFQWVYF